ncbi:unnamed protein product, partial [Hymenolepis diminuta]|uniref:Bestrophin homolog n=1 Tax=Hymenolepis diminuta TaxID=6216 RepID=A0A0R3SR82_HYMDI
VGILTQREGDLIETTDPVAAQPFLPLVWATAISMRAEKDGYIKNPHTLVNLIKVMPISGDRHYRLENGDYPQQPKAIAVINDFRESLLRLFLMDKVCVPLVYTQVVTLAVYSYFLSSIIGRQFIVNSSINSKPFRKDYYIPLYTILEFIVYMGWLKVAETLVNPMGEDDEDFDINAIIDSNWSHGKYPLGKKRHEILFAIIHTNQSTCFYQSMELDDLDVPIEALGSRFRLFDSTDQHSLSADQLPIPQGSQASIIQPQLPTPSDAGLPALAEEDEDNTSQQEEDEEEVEFEQTQTEEPHAQSKQEDESQIQPQQELQSKQQVKEENVQPIPILKVKEMKKKLSKE